MYGEDWAGGCDKQESRVYWDVSILYQARIGMYWGFRDRKAPDVPGRSQGFTLIELLLSISLGAIILTAVYAAYSGATRASQRVEFAASEIQAWRFFVERLRSDLVNLQVPYGDERIKGDSHDLSFKTVDTETVSIRVRYQWQKSRRQGVIHREVWRDKESRIAAVYEGVEQMRLRYLTKAGWQERIKGDGQIPKAVECVVTVNGRERLAMFAIEVEPVPAP